ncbi:Arabinose 5-phosphate isomerase KpsF [Caloramator mitchellensis]|uniref:Arabinose 5-phosphate isomerase KpsF n=1 Tax=Caloramator mitchellensis TaxID=908809 RepID=A0A0R3K006_CALMK|nr:CBS domain-containing protein [Caloramator mitchellensis]KRQ86213.1 Arabinose 5-phosphate isomerase KpsF [Caloramator mitchellensis]
MVKNILSNDFIKLRVDESVNDALTKMEEKKKSVAVVVDGDDNLKGIIVKADIYRFLKETGHFAVYPVEIAMTKKVITAKEEDSIVDVAKLLRQNNVSAIPIVKGNKVIGLIALEDIVDRFIEENS